MIVRLRGRVVAVDDDEVTVDVGGVGYQVFVHLRTAAGLHAHASGGDEVTLHVHTAVSDDAIRLFGFQSREELRIFGLLLGVERIGPRAALGILGRAEPATLVRAIRAGEVAMLSSVPGIGRKTAERVILELRDKLDDLAPPGHAAPRPGGTDHVAAAALAGLTGLGFREAEARGAVAEALAAADGDPVEVTALVGAALRRLDQGTSPPEVDVVGRRRPSPGAAAR